MFTNCTAFKRSPETLFVVGYKVDKARRTGSLFGLRVQTLTPTSSPSHPLTNHIIHIQLNSQQTRSMRQWSNRPALTWLRDVLNSCNLVQIPPKYRTCHVLLDPSLDNFIRKQHPFSFFTVHFLTELVWIALKKPTKKNKIEIRY